MKEEEVPHFLFARYNISWENVERYEIDQYHYLSKIEDISIDAPLSEFSSMHKKLARIGLYSPDCRFDISQLSRVTEAILKDKSKKHIKRMKNSILYAVSNIVSIQFQCFDT